jgi:hypothetical protein
MGLGEETKGMKVIYRMTDIPSTNESPVFWDNKFRLNEICLRSFVRAFRDIKPQVAMICDHCPDFYEEFVKGIVPFPMTIEFTEMGVKQNALHQYDFVLDDDIYYLLECDYLHTPDAGQKMLDAVTHFDWITGYDHPDKYKEGMIPKQNERKIINGHEWRTTDSTTSTFMARGSKIREQMELFKRYGWDDHKRWLDLNERGYVLGSPIPSLSTHLVTEYLASNVDWKSLWSKYE